MEDSTLEGEKKLPPIASKESKTKRMLGERRKPENTLQKNFLDFESDLPIKIDDSTTYPPQPTSRRYM